MSIDDLLLPDQASEQFHWFARHPKNIGSMPDPSARGSAVGQCGDAVEVHLRIENGTIADIRVIPYGCIYTLVCASAMSELAKGRELERALELEPDDVVAAVGGLPEDHVHCARLAVNTLGEAIADYYRRESSCGSNGSA